MSRNRFPEPVDRRRLLNLVQASDVEMDDCLQCTGDTPVTPVVTHVLLQLHPALDGEDVVLAVTAMPTEGPDGDEAAVGGEAAQSG
jgi:hypothetical protein